MYKGKTLGRNLTMLTDLYQLTMMKGHFDNDSHNRKVAFNLFFRKNPFGSSYSITAGLEQVIEYIENLEFTSSNIDYLNSLKIFDSNFLDYLKNFKFTGDIYAIPEGNAVFPQEPLIQVVAPVNEAQVIETTMLNLINHQSLIATKASRVAYSANGKPILEGGLRRAQGPDASLFGARAAMIGGCASTSNVLAGELFGVPIGGTFAHSFVMFYDDEYKAFQNYAKSFSDKCICLVDTYNTLESGVKNAIRLFDFLKESNMLPETIGIRLDSGDLAYLSKEARKMLDKAGYTNAIIVASNDLDEYLIQDLKVQEARINSYLVGTNLITAKDCPAFGGVYKLAAVADDNGKLVPRIKLSENIEKTTNPGLTKVARLYDKNGKIQSDILLLKEESISSDVDLTLTAPLEHWKQKTFKANEFTVKELLTPIFKDGKVVYNSPSVMEIRDYCLEQQNTLWDECRRLANPHTVPVDLSDKLYDLKMRLIYKGKHK